MQVIEAQRASITEPHDHLHISHVRSSPQSQEVPDGLICIRPSGEIAKAAAEQNGGSGFRTGAAAGWAVVTG
jgi:hypothetical protein